MSIPISELKIDWGFLRTYIDTRDAHAEVHRALLARVEKALAGSDDASSLAEKVERWRYQWLAEHEGAGDDEDRRAAAVLDDLYAALVGRETQPGREARAHVFSETFAADRVAALEWATDPNVAVEEVARRARQTTRRDVVRDVHLYAPIYLSSHCVNHCTYCGFRYTEDIPRRHLDEAEAVEQARYLYERGMRRLLLVAGDFPKLTGVAYYTSVCDAIRQEFPDVELSVEIAPQSTAAYAALAAHGVEGVTLYQETYQERLYREYHPRGPKAHFEWRLEGHDRVGEAGIRKLGLGVLLGLADPVADVRAMIRHAAYLEKRFPDACLAFSLPRIHEAPAGFTVPYPVDDETFVRLYCGLRLAFPQAELVLSTRELPELRGKLVDLCVTRISAGSSTVPGGYEDQSELPLAGPGEQFPVCDHRPIGEVVSWLEQAGYRVCWGGKPHAGGERRPR